MQKGHGKLCKARDVMALRCENTGSGDSSPSDLDKLLHTTESLSPSHNTSLARQFLTQPSNALAKDTAQTDLHKSGTNYAKKSPFSIFAF